MEWKQPPKIKIYEALGCIGNNHIKITDDGAFVLSSTGGKAYTVVYDPEINAITANDNGSYWQGYMGYPIIAYLMKKGIIQYNQDAAEALKEFVWKDLNERFKRDYDKTIAHVHAKLSEDDISLVDLEQEIKHIAKQVEGLHLHKLQTKSKPPV
jgi:hypothetical protein